MRIQLQKKYFYFILFVLIGHLGFSQLSKTHYIPPLTESGDNSSAPEDQYIYISTPSNATVNFKIKPVGLDPTNYITGTLSKAAPYVYTVGNGRNTQLFVNVNETSSVKTNKGYIIEAEKPVYVSVRMNAGAQAGALVSKGTSALGNTFRVGSFTNGSPTSNYLNFVSVMATEDNTQVTFSNLPAGLIIENYTGTTPITRNLNKGDSYTLATNSASSTINRDGLIGCLVNSDKPIVVNCGSANGSFGTGTGRDYGIDQIVDLTKVGTEYIFVRGDGNDAWENVLLVPHTPGTTFIVNDGAPTPINYPYQIIEGGQYNANGNMYVETSQPVFAYQGVGGLGNNGTANEANQGLFFVPPLSCETRGNLDNIANINNIGNTNYDGGISIVTKVGATVTINGAPIAVASRTVTGKPDYITYKIKGLNGNISVQSTDELYCAYFNYNGAATSGSFYSGFPSPPEINFDAQFATLGNCIPNITLEAANAQNFDSYEWFYDNGSGFQLLASNVPSITPTISARYKLIGIITCTGETLESVEVPVSICPDDTDNDGIIDNIDIDNDNDGILNCTESRGDVAINLSDVNNPELIFQDNSTNSTIVSGVYTKFNDSGNTNLFTGNSNGNFTSSISNGNNSENSYSISFTESVNLKFEGSIAFSLDGESFVVNVLPINKNITLLDPDDRLLIDSNFDGIFETGITQISGSEIRYKINPSPSGNTPYQFLANKINRFSFTHKLDNNTASSGHSGRISLTCFKNDNDLDGITDEFDLDSDNDGIPDSIEKQGVLVTLLGTDANLDGLDDAYNASTLPKDTDADGILDFYDLDSDNDGITDLIESGQLGNFSDTNLDGIEDGQPIGVNGWVDVAETSPDSNEIGYILNDSDNDSIFSYIDADSDGDGCSDVIEAGFSDTNNDGFLGDSATIIVDDNGLVTNATDGYTLPDSNYLNFAPLSIDTQPMDTEVCEASTGTISIISPNAETYQWEVSTDGIIWNLIFDDAVYSNSQTSALTITNTPISFNNYQYRVKIDRNGNSCGLYSDEIELTVILLPIANTAPNMLLCDDDNNGTMSFNLMAQNALISSITGMTITYHASQADANTGNAPITSPFESGNTIIFARVENDSNTTCYGSSSFNLEVYDSAFPQDTASILPIQECDDTSVGTDTDGLKTFNLTQKETEILNGQAATDFNLTYFTDTNRLPASQIANPLNFPNTVSGGQTIYVRMTNNFYSTCFADTAFEVEVYELPQVNNPNVYSQCDDASNDGQAFFNLELNNIKENINTNYLTEGLIFTFYEDQIEAETNGTAIVNPSNYQDALGFTPETIWVRVENPNSCFRLVPLTLEVSPSSTALNTYSPNSIYQCDDGVDLRDGIATFDLTTIQNFICTSIFSTFNVTVHFYESQLDAELETNEISTPSNHQNTNSPNSQDIWVRIKSNLGNNCLGLKRFPNLLIVEALPTANSISISRQCDFDTSDSVLSYPFNTSQIENDLLGSQNPADVTITYFDELGNALPSPLPNPFLTETQTISIRVTNNITSDTDGPCYDETTLEFIIDVQPVANPVASQAVCDGDAGDIDDDGMYPFDTSTFTSTILGTQSGMEIYYDYTDENGNLITNSTTLPNPLISKSQTISVEVINPINTSCPAKTKIELVVNSLPEFTVNTPEIVCSSDPTFSILLDPIEANPLEFFDYVWFYTSLDGTITNQFVSIDDSVTISEAGTYTVTLSKQNPDGSICSKSRDIFVDASEAATITKEDVDINDLRENNSVTIDTTNLGLGNYQFALVEKDSNIINYRNVPFFNNVRAGFYTIYVNDPICSFRTLDISVIGHPRYFTPNNDNINDLWQIRGVSQSIQANSTILIFNRYGRLIKQLLVESDGWDGTANGSPLPSDDYWFKVFLQDGRQYSGHFTLKR